MKINFLKYIGLLCLNLTIQFANAQQFDFEWGKIEDPSELDKNTNKFYKDFRKIAKKATYIDLLGEYQNISVYFVNQGNDKVLYALQDHNLEKRKALKLALKDKQGKLLTGYQVFFEGNIITIFANGKGAKSPEFDLYVCKYNLDLEEISPPQFIYSHAYYGQSKPDLNLYSINKYKKHFLVHFDDYTKQKSYDYALFDFNFQKIWESKFPINDGFEKRYDIRPQFLPDHVDENDSNWVGNSYLDEELNLSMICLFSKREFSGDKVLKMQLFSYISKSGEHMVKTINLKGSYFKHFYLSRNENQLSLSYLVTDEVPTENSIDKAYNGINCTTFGLPEQKIESDIYYKFSNGMSGIEKDNYAFLDKNNMYMNEIQNVFFNEDDVIFVFSRTQGLYAISVNQSNNLNWGHGFSYDQFTNRRFPLNDFHGVKCFVNGDNLHLLFNVEHKEYKKTGKYIHQNIYEETIIPIGITINSKGKVTQNGPLTLPGNDFKIILNPLMEDFKINYIHSYKIKPTLFHYDKLKVIKGKIKFK